MVALSLSVMLLFRGLPLLPGLSSFSASQVLIFLIFALSVEMYCSSFSMTALSVSSYVSFLVLARSSPGWPSPSSLFYVRVPPWFRSTPSRRSRGACSRLRRTSLCRSGPSGRRSGGLRGRAYIVSWSWEEMKSAMVVKCGRVSAERAMKMTLSLQQSAIFLLEVIPLE